MQIYNGVLERDHTNANSMGGTELLATRLLDGLDKDLLDKVQIVVSREYHELDPTKLRIYYAHDLPGDPEATKALGDGRWKRYHKLVFVSNWQQQEFIRYYDLPWSHCVVLRNSIEPITPNPQDDGIIRLAYWSTPHRGLNILLPVFDKLCEEYDNLELNVFSSFKLYGWEENDRTYEQLFETCRTHPKINYYGTLSNTDLRDHIAKCDILAYPNTWQETSCLVLIEAMSAGLICVHPNYAALPETARGFTMMYNWCEDLNLHAHAFYNVLKMTLERMKNEPEEMRSFRENCSEQNSIFYDHTKVIMPAWNLFLRSMLTQIKL